MKKSLKLGIVLGSVGLLSLAGGCSGGPTLRDGFRAGASLISKQKEALKRAKEDGLPATELDTLIEKAGEWIAEVAPSHPRVVEASYQKIFVVGGTVNRSNADEGYQSVSDAEVAIRTEDLFFSVTNAESMRYNFVFFDRTTDFHVDLTGLTGDLKQYGDPLGRGNDASPETYNPDDIYLMKLSFNENQDLREKNSTITFTLRVIIEWGGRPGQVLYSNKFESKLVFDNGNYLGYGGGWKAVE